MNPPDSKKLDRNTLEELREQHRQGKNSLAAHQALINGLEYHLAEQDQEIAELRARLPGTDALWTLKERDDAKKLIIEQILEIERLREKQNRGGKALSHGLKRAVEEYKRIEEARDILLETAKRLQAMFDYQRRHRKWALHLLMSCREYALAYQQAAEKAEAELAVCRKQEMANLEGFNACAAERFDLKIRVKELEQELLWAADACEKAENLLAEKEKV